MSGKKNPENSTPYESELTNSYPEDIKDQNECDTFAQYFPQEENDLSQINCINEIQIINNRTFIQHNAFQLSEEMLTIILKPPLANIESQNIPQHQKKIIVGI